MSEYTDKFEEFVKASGWRTACSPSQLMVQWREFVDGLAEDGYQKQTLLLKMPAGMMHLYLWPQKMNLGGINAFL